MRAIVFALRGLGAGWLGAYGNEWVATPHLDRLAAEGIVFDRHYSDGPEPAAANRAWFDGGRLHEQLHAADVPTILVRANHPDTDAPAAFSAAWSELFDARPQAEDASPLDNLIRSLPAVLDKLAARPRWLLWIEVDRLLPPWDVPPEVFEAYIADEDEPPEEPIEPFADPPTGPFDRTDLAAWDWLHGTFAAVATALDAELGSIFDELRGRGLDQTAAWLVASDFGYPLGEHGQIGVHGPGLHEELVHLPWVVRLPGAAQAGRRVASFTQPADQAALLRELFADPANALEAICRNAETRDRVMTRLDCGGAKEIAIRTSEWTFLFSLHNPPDEPPRPPQLFARPDDRWEVNDVLRQHPEIAEQFQAACEQTAPLPSNASSARAEPQH